jgi:hypothetical protein
MNKELKLTALALKAWPKNAHSVAWIDDSGGGRVFIYSKKFPISLSPAHSFIKGQWQAARIELGLDSPFTSPEEDEAWADAERRMDTIGQNGNTAEHYDEPPAIEYTRTAEQFLSQAADLLIERGKQYDKPDGERSMGSTVKAFNAITNKTLSESEGWLFMSILKRVRQFQGPYHKDSAEDSVSYSALEAEALERGL